MNDITTQGAQGITRALADDFIKYLDVKPRTVQAYKTNIRLFIEWLERENITQPTRDDIIKYRDEIRAKCKPATVQAYITSIRLFFDWLDMRGIYPNIARHVKGAKLDKGHKKDYLTADQARALLDSIKTRSAKGKRDYAIVLLMLSGGLRDVEIMRANVGDLRRLAGSRVLYIQGKGHEEKNDFIKLPEETYNAIKRYLKTRGKLADNAPLFASLARRNAGERMTTRSISVIVKDRLREAGYNSDRITAHSLRHTAVTLALLAGATLPEAQQFARHENIATTQIYAHDLKRINNRCEQNIIDSIFG